MIAELFGKILHFIHKNIRVSANPVIKSDALDFITDVQVELDINENCRLWICL